jgi:hypothetical protein
MLVVIRPGAGLIASYDARMEVVKTWCNATRCLLKAGLVLEDDVAMPESLILLNALSTSPHRTGDCVLMGLFGVQGLDGGSYLAELRETLSTIKSMASKFVSSVAGPLKEYALSQKDGTSAHYYGKFGLDVMH